MILASLSAVTFLDDFADSILSLNSSIILNKSLEILFLCIQLKMLKVQSDFDCNTVLHNGSVKSILQCLNHCPYLLLCMNFPLLL